MFPEQGRNCSFNGNYGGRSRRQWQREGRPDRCFGSKRSKNRRRGPSSHPERSGLVESKSGGGEEGRERSGRAKKSGGAGAHSSDSFMLKIFFPRDLTERLFRLLALSLSIKQSSDIIERYNRASSSTVAVRSTERYTTARSCIRAEILLGARIMPADRSLEIALL